MKKSYIADNIIREYTKKKRYNANKTRAELELFKRKVCSDCKNKSSSLCCIKRDLKGNLQCVFKK